MGSPFRWVLVLLLCGLPFFSCWGQIAIIGPLTHEFIVAPGEEYSGTIEIANGSDAPVQVSAIQADYLFFSDGSNVYSEPGMLERSNAAWISLYIPDGLTIAAGDAVEVPFAIQIPNDPSLTGTFWSMVFVSPVLPPADAEEGAAVRQVVQYGIQIVTHIGDTGVQKIEITDAQVQDGDVGRILEVDVSNTGERWVRITTWAEIYNADGTLVERVEVSGKRMYPGTSVRFRYELPTLDSGTYKALIVFDNALVDENIWGLQIDLNIAESGD